MAVDLNPTVNISTLAKAIIIRAISTMNQCPSKQAEQLLVNKQINNPQFIAPAPSHSVRCYFPR